MQQLNGSVHLVAGNHDIYSAKEKGLKNFSSVKEQRFIEVGGQKIYLNHYPFLAYVGVDNNDFRPVSFAEVKMKIENQINFKLISTPRKKNNSWKQRSMRQSFRN